VDGDRVLRQPAQGAVSRREHLSPMGEPPSDRCMWSSRSTRDGAPPVAAFGVADPHGAGPLRSTAPPPLLPPPTPRLYVVPCRGSPPSSCAIAPGRLGSDERGSCQLCTTDLVGGVAEQVVQLKL
jgi:hypothetical protein